MRKALAVALVIGLFFNLSLLGCASQKAESSNEAISIAGAMETAKEKYDYLIGQAKAFYNSEDFQGAIDIAKYILQYLDKDSQSAKDLIEKAKAALEAKAKSAVEDVKGALGDFSK